MTCTDTLYEIEEKQEKEEPEISSPQSSTPAELVDAINLVFGKQTHNRAIHSKGIVLEGRFLPSPSAAILSKASHFQSAAVPVTVRFSNFAGIPTITDTDALANPRGLAVKFYLPDGAETDLVIHSFNGFPAATTDEFRELLIAIASSGTGVAAPTPADTFLATHPVAKSFLESQQPRQLVMQRSLILESTASNSPIYRVRLFLAVTVLSLMRETIFCLQKRLKKLLLITLSMRFASEWSAHQLSSIYVFKYRNLEIK